MPTSSLLLAYEPNVNFQVIATVGDKVDTKADGSDYRMVGIPDGLGAFDNGDGTITVLMNHEIGVADGIVREHGAKGSFVSEWTLNKSDLSIVNVEDAIKQVKLWDRFDSDGDGDANVDFQPAAPFAIGRLCSADLAEVSAYYFVDNMGTEDASDDIAYGTEDRIFLTGEEFSPTVTPFNLGGREFGYVATGAEEGIAYELAHFGYFAWENAISSNYAQRKTINISMDDGLNGQVYVYVGDKQTEGTAVDKAGLTFGKMYGIKVDSLAANNNNESDAFAASGRFEMVLEESEKSPGGDISLLTGTELDNLSESKGVASFARPEDGQFDTQNPNVFWFVTTASITGQSRLYKMTYDDITQPELGGTIEAVLSSSDLPVNDTVGVRMMDNMTVTAEGKIIIQEDVGGNSHLGRVFEYDPVTDTLAVIGIHDAGRFIAGAPGFLTIDEESSGVIDVTDLLGDEDTQAFLLDIQAHQNLRLIDPELVENGQFLAMFVDDVNGNGTAAAEALNGSFTADTLLGKGGNDTLRGGSNSDTLKGGAGDDVLVGGSGKDVMNGGAGADSFVFASGDTGVGALADRIVGFETDVDIIDLTALSDTTLVSIAALSATKSLVLIDQDANGVAEMQIDVRGSISLTDILV